MHHGETVVEATAGIKPVADQGEAAGDAGAQALLSAAQRAATPAAELERRFTDMTSYGEGPPTIVQAVTTLQDWPDKKPGDVEWVYVAVANDSYSEGITVVVCREGERLAIRSLEWGRP